MAVLALVLAAPFANCFNVDMAHPVIFRGPVTDPYQRQTRADTYFGFSVGLGGVGAGDAPWLLVGAPRANSTLGLNPPQSVLEPGAVFKCPLRRGTSCQEVLVDRTGNEPGGNFAYTDLKDQGWLGGAMDVLADGCLAVSAFRWRNTKYPNKYLGNGVCYMADRYARDDSFEKSVPLYDRDRQNFILPNRNLAYFFSYGQAGTSVHFPENGRELILGAPGVFDWTGTLIRYSDVSRVSSAITVPNPYLTETLQRYDYLGYSVSSGRFSSDSQKTMYVAGAPRGAEGKGRVLLVDFPPGDDLPFSVQAEWVGSSVGEYFGAAVLAIDLNGDGLSDVVVGAPHFGEGDSFEQGKIYVFMNADRGLFRSARSSVGKATVSARFGTALAPLGDLDNDGFNDLAVGAPYEEEGRGAVYIFRGGSGAFPAAASQRIAASDLNNGLRGFGVSISRGVDVDDNQYPDLAVGAYASGDAVLLRTSPVLEFVATLTSEPDKLEATTREFQVQACLLYHGKYVSESLSVNATLKMESFHAQSVIVVNGRDMRSVEFVWQVVRDKTSCSPFTVAIRSRDRIDYTKPIKLSMMYKLLSKDDNKPGQHAVFIDTDTSKRVTSRRRRRQAPTAWDQIDEFCKSCPVSLVDKDNQKLVTLQVPFANGCGSDLVCSTDLKLSYVFPDITNNEYVIGSTKTLQLELRLTNGGEPASLPSMTVTMPWPLSVVRVPPSCQERTLGLGSSLTCTVQPHPFYSDSHFHITLPLDMAGVTSEFGSLKLNVSVTSTSEELNPQDNVANITLNLLSQADMEIIGKAFQDQVFYDSEEERSEDDKGKPDYHDIQHTYQLLKYLPTPVEAVDIWFWVPVNFTSGDRAVNFLRLYPPSAQIGSEPFSCSLQSSDTLRAGRPNDASDVDDPYPTAAPAGRRRRRDVQSAVEDEAADDAYPLQCSAGSRVQCVRVRCQAVSFLDTSTEATVTLSMRVDANALGPLLADQGGAAVLVTRGEVKLREGSTVSPEFNTRPDSASVRTLLLPGTPQSQPVAAWIIVVSVLGALLLLAAIIYVLYRMGFFKRSKRDQLLEEQQGTAGETDKLNTVE